MPFDPRADEIRAKVAKIRERLQNPPPGATEEHRKEAESVLYDLEAQLADLGQESSDFEPMSPGYEEAGRASIGDPEALKYVGGGPAPEPRPVDETAHTITLESIEKVAAEAPPRVEGTATGRPELWAPPEVEGEGAPYFWEEPTVEDAEATLQAARETASPVERAQIDNALVELAEFGAGSEPYRRFADAKWQLVAQSFKKLGKPAVRVKYAKDRSLLAEGWKAVTGEDNELGKAAWQTVNAVTPLALGVEEGMTAGLGRMAIGKLQGVLEEDEIAELREAGVLPSIEQEYAGLMERHPAARMVGSLTGLMIPGGPLGKVAGAAGKAAGKTAATMVPVAPKLASAVAGGAGAGMVVGGATEGVQQMFGEGDLGAVGEAAADTAVAGGLFGGFLGGVGAGATRLRSALRRGSKELKGVELFEEAGGKTSFNPFKGALDLPKATKEYLRRPLDKEGLLNPEGQALRDAANAIRRTGMARQEAIDLRGKALAEAAEKQHAPAVLTNTASTMERLASERMGSLFRTDSQFERLYRETFPTRIFNTAAEAKAAGYTHRIMDLGDGVVVGSKAPMVSSRQQFEQTVRNIDRLAKWGADKGMAGGPDEAFRAMGAAIRADRAALYGEDYAAAKAAQGKAREAMERAKQQLGMSPTAKFNPDDPAQFEAIFNRLRQYSSGMSPNDATIREFLRQSPEAMAALRNYAAIKHYNRMMQYGSSQYASSDIAPTLERKGIARVVARLPLISDALLRDTASLVAKPRAGGLAGLRTDSLRPPPEDPENAALLERMIQIAAELSQERAP